MILFDFFAKLIFGLYIFFQSLFLFENQNNISVDADKHWQPLQEDNYPVYRPSTGFMLVWWWWGPKCVLKGMRMQVWAVQQLPHDLRHLDPVFVLLVLCVFQSTFFQVCNRVLSTIQWQPNPSAPVRCAKTQDNLQKQIVFCFFCFLKWRDNNGVQIVIRNDNILVVRL